MLATLFLALLVAATARSAPGFDAGRDSVELRKRNPKEMFKFHINCTGIHDAYCMFAK